MRRASLFLFLFVHGFVASAQNDFVGSGRAIEFDGIDDYIDLGDIYDDLALPMTISAWVYVDPNSEIIQYPIFDSQDNSSTYNGFTFVCSTLPHIGYTIGDGKGGNNPAFRRSRAGYFETLGRWVHMTAVAKSGYDIALYMNGELVQGEYQGSSPYPMNSNSPGEVAKIGFLFSNGTTFRFKGIMDEVRIYDRALTVQEIRETMCKRLRGDESGLIGYWNFDEMSGDVLKDFSPNGFDGLLKGNPKRVFSGAPIGDESVALYTTNWTGKSVSLKELSVSNIEGQVYGVHIYRVSEIPSQTGGLNMQSLPPEYFGVFLADDHLNTSFDFIFAEDAVCHSFQRKENSKPLWHQSETLADISNRMEIIPTFDEGTLSVDLGEDLVLCNEDEVFLQAHPQPLGKTFKWNTGDNTEGITVRTSGVYSVEVIEDCLVDSDTIEISIQQAPPSFSLGEDEIFCVPEIRVLTASLNEADFDFTWNDGSKSSTLVANDFGTYWLRIENACGTALDSVTLSRKVLTDIETFNFISPNNHDNRNQFFIVDERIIGSQLSVFNRWGKPVFETPVYQNNWDGDDLPAGVYFYTITGECIGPLKGTLTIMR